MTKTIAEKSVDTLLIENRLRQTEVNDEVSYNELSTILGRDVRQFCAYNLYSARNCLEREGIFFETIRNQGVKRIDNRTAVTTSVKFVNQSRRAASRGIKRLSSVPFAELDEESKKEHLSRSAQFGAISLFSKESAHKKIATKVDSNSERVPVGKVLELFQQYR